MEKSRIRDKHPGSATLIQYFTSASLYFKVKPGPDPGFINIQNKFNLDFNLSFLKLYLSKLSTKNAKVLKLYYVPKIQK